MTVATARNDEIDGARARGLRVSETWLILGWWLAWGLYMTGHHMAADAFAGAPMDAGSAASTAFVAAATWALITFIVFWMSRRLPLDRKPRAVLVIIYVAAGGALSLGEVLVSYIVLPLLGRSVLEFTAHFVVAFPGNLVQYWLLVGVAWGLNYYRRYRQREAHSERLKTQLAQAELHLLKSQLHPHFLFNTLNAISALMHRDPRAADRMIARLSDLLRVALDYSGTEEVTLREELAFLEPYLEIERTRYGERLTVDFAVQPNVLDARVPHMILQPLVENAIRHGVAPRAGPGHITVGARGRRGMLDLEVRDDGPGMPKGRSPNGGLGLAITKARLEQLYGERYEFDPKNASDGGFRVSITIPFRLAPGADANAARVEAGQGPAARPEQAVRRTGASGGGEG